MFWKIHQKCYMIGTIISNIIGKMTEKNELGVGIPLKTRENPKQ